jgi:SET domain
MPSWWNSQFSSSSQRAILLSQQVRRLLLKSTKTPPPFVEIRDHSQIAGAGRGVFSTTRIPNQTAFCLYPGVYTPGLPMHTVVTSAANAHDNVVVYLGKSSPPSAGAGDFDTNAYILNVQLPTGGYLDGLALEYTTTTFDRNDETVVHRRLDENPNACGHCINHSSARANAEVISIDWTDIMLAGRRVVHEDESSSSRSKEEEEEDDRCYYAIPNIVRADKSPWYAVIGEEHNSNDTNNDDNDNHNGIFRFTGTGKCCGAVFCATRDIDAGEEILFDYALFPPLPAWAKDWYDAAQ